MSFFEGVARVLDLFAVFDRDLDAYVCRDDNEAIASDWSAIADDMRKVMT